MPYTTDGSSHSNGIDLELQIIDFINKSYENGDDILNIYDEIKGRNNSVGKVCCLHVGGTQSKSDAILFCTDEQGKELKTFSISIKRKLYKGNKPKGTFDIINTTLEKFNNQYNVIPIAKVQQVNNWLASKKLCIGSKADIDSIREDYQNLCSMLLEETIHDADRFIALARNEFIKTDILIVGKIVKIGAVERITDIFVAKEKDIKMFEQEKLSGNTYLLEQGRGKSSRRIIVKTSDGSEYKTPYRVRCVLNNGLSAFFGLSKANKYSVLTIKIQVDDVKYIIKQMNEFKLN